MLIPWDQTELRITLTGRSGWQRGQRFGWRNSVPGHDIWYVIGGKGVLHGKGGAKIPLSTGTCLWLTAGHEYEAWQEPDDPVRNYYVHFDLFHADGRRRSMDDPHPPEVIAPRTGVLVDVIVRQVVELIPFYSPPIAERFPAASVAIANQLMRALAMELDESSQSARSLSAAQRYHSEAVMWAIARMQDQLDTPCTVAGLAEEVGYSAEHFSRVFRAVIGRSPEEFLVNLRIERAKQLLATSSLTIEAIANSLGYGQPSYFSTQFRKRAGLSPRDYRQAHSRQAS